MEVLIKKVWVNKNMRGCFSFLFKVRTFAMSHRERIFGGFVRRRGEEKRVFEEIMRRKYEKVEDKGKEEYQKMHRE